MAPSWDCSIFMTLCKVLQEVYGEIWYRAESLDLSPFAFHTIAISIDLFSLFFLFLFGWGIERQTRKKSWLVLFQYQPWSSQNTKCSFSQEIIHSVYVELELYLSIHQRLVSYAVFIWAAWHCSHTINMHHSTQTHPMGNFCHFLNGS